MAFQRGLEGYVLFSKWKLGREDREARKAFCMEETHVQRPSDLSGGQQLLWNSRREEDSSENEIKEITQRRIKKGPDCIYKALGLSFINRKGVVRVFSRGAP